MLVALVHSWRDLAFKYSLGLPCNKGTATYKSIINGRSNYAQILNISPMKDDYKVPIQGLCDSHMVSFSIHYSPQSLF